MKIYGDVLAAVNFTVTLLILQLSGRILGIRPGRAVKYISGALEPLPRLLSLCLFIR